jgi:hypothetical protein
MSLASVVGVTLVAQGERVAAFKAWDAALAEYLKDGDAAIYRQKVNCACPQQGSIEHFQF